MTDELTKMIQDASRRVEKTFRKHGNIGAPVYRALDGDGEWFVIAAPFQNAGQKFVMRAMVRDTFGRRNVQRYVHVAEAWTSSPDLACAPVDDPNRGECILFVAEDRTSGLVTGLRFIDRSGKRPKLTPLTIERPKELRGRMGSMLTPRGTDGRN